MANFGVGKVLLPELDMVLADDSVNDIVVGLRWLGGPNPDVTSHKHVVGGSHREIWVGVGIEENI